MPGSQNPRRLPIPDAIDLPVRIFRGHENAEPPTESESDQRVGWLTGELARGNEEAFREFFDGYSSRVYRLFLVLTRGDDQLSRELMQQVFIKAARGIPRFTAENKLWSWLARVAKNAFIDHLRRTKPHGLEVEIAAREMEGRVETGADPELLGALELSVAELLPEEQELIEAVYYDQMPHKEVAEQRATTPKAVESKLARIRAKLRAALLKRM